MMNNSLCAWARARLPLWMGPSARADMARGPAADDDGPGAHDRALLERHLAECPACAAHRAGLDRAMAALALAADDWPLAPDAPSLWPDLERRIAARSQTSAHSNANTSTSAGPAARLRNWRGRVRAFLDLDRPLRLVWTRDALAESLAQFRANRANRFPGASARANAHPGAIAPGWAWWTAGLAAGALLLALVWLPPRGRSPERPGNGDATADAGPDVLSRRDGRSSFAALQALRGERRRPQQRPRPRRWRTQPPAPGQFAGPDANEFADEYANEHAPMAADWDRDRGPGHEVVSAERASALESWRAARGAPEGPSSLPGLNELARADVPSPNHPTASVDRPAPKPSSDIEPETAAKTETATATDAGKLAAPVPVPVPVPAHSAHRWNYDLEHGFPMFSDDDDDGAKPVY